MNFEVGEGHRALNEQLGVALHPVFMFRGGPTCFVVFMTCYVSASVGLRTACLNEILVHWYDPEGIKALSVTAGGKALLARLIFLVLYFSFGMAGHFKGRKPWAGDRAFFTRYLPVVCLVSGVAVSHFAARSVELTMAGNGAGFEMGWPAAADRFMYLPFRYLITGATGISWASVMVSLGALVALFFTGM